MARTKAESIVFKEKFVPSQADIEMLREGMKPFEQKKFGNKLVSRFEQYCDSKGVTRITPEGEVVVRDAQGYTRLMDIEAKLKYQEYQNQEKIYESFPEKRQEAMMRLRNSNPFKKMLTSDEE